MVDPYLQKNGVLKNKLGIDNQDILNQAEVDFSCNAIHDLCMHPLPGNYDFEHFCRFHQRVFEDVYEWAGKPRSIHIEKSEKVLSGWTIEYAEPKEIKSDVSKVLSTMKSRDWEHMKLDERVTYFSQDLASLWKVHAFREGNTRISVTFLCQFLESRGIPVNRTLFEKHSAYTRNALVMACAYFKDGSNFQNTSYLENIVKGSLQTGEVASSRTSDEEER